MKKIASIIAAVALLSVSAFAADMIRAGGSGVIVNSALGSTSGLVTNGLYPTSLAGSVTATNLVLLNPNSFYGDHDISIQITAAASAATTTNAVFVFSATTGNPVSITNGASTGWAGSFAPRATYGTYTLQLNGTTPVTTNVILWAGSTPGFVNGVDVYLEQVQMGASASAVLTNYSVTVVQ